jgi:hypothetical protein
VKLKIKNAEWKRLELETAKNREDREVKSDKLEIGSVDITKG